VLTKFDTIDDKVSVVVVGVVGGGGGLLACCRLVSMAPVRTAFVGQPAHQIP
jgi:hypothetical protein